MQIFGKFGLWSFAFGTLSFIAVVLMKIFMNFDMTGNPLLSIGVLFVLVGVQFFIMGLLAEINTRTYHESQSKPVYKIREIIE